MSIEDAARSKAQYILETQGIEITCPSCKEKFIGRSLLVKCPNCNKTFDVEFNIK